MTDSHLSIHVLFTSDYGPDAPADEYIVMVDRDDHTLDYTLIAEDALHALAQWVDYAQW